MPRGTLSSSEVCAIFGISKSTLFRWEREGIIPEVPRVRVGLMEERVYGAEHLRRIAGLIGKSIVIPDEPVLAEISVLVDKRQLRSLAKVIEEFVQRHGGAVKGVG